ncbi:MAG: cellobiose phosphorylase [Candidatus Omnitrophica bacterium]|nr:cellobiose phosphorylase [Candidatus Omnitrophota bacterium]
MPKYTLDRNGIFIIEDYNKAKSFSSFLPAISGKFGMPLWCFYVNRAQAVASFGIKSKDNSILEFLPANKTYASVFTKGFRTFLKEGKLLHEPFMLNDDARIKQTMKISSSFLEIEEENKRTGLDTKVTYFTLPCEEFASLVRIVEIRNTLSKSRTLDILDGLSSLVCYGARDLFLKHLSRTLEAWMDSFFKNNIAFFRLRVSPQDTAQTTYITGANFYFSCFFDKNNKASFLRPVVDSSCIFREDSSLAYPYNFTDSKFNYPKKQILAGRTPCAFGFTRLKMGPESSFKFFTFIGSTETEQSVWGFAKGLDQDKICEKFRENIKIIEKIKNKALVKSSSPKFDLYIQQNYLDNVLRGGFPEDFKDKNSSRIYYIYSRKHGDLERDYNRFKLQDSFLSAGEGNFRDVNQNRRCDNFFSPCVQKENIYLFFNLQRPDSYNPLVVMPPKFVFLSKEKLKSHFKDLLADKLIEEIIKNFSREFFLADLLKFLKQKKVSCKLWDKLVFRALCSSAQVENAEFGEGFWIDHWTYNLDLIENYLSIFPDREKELLFEEKYFFYDDFCKVNPRNKRLHLKEGRIYQHNFLHFDPDKAHLINSRDQFKYRVRIRDSSKILYTNLLVKMLVIVLNKVSSLDPFGKGIEMEAGKPGWCDSLNGLPAISGSSLAETFELKKLCLFLSDKLKKYPDRQIQLPAEIHTFFKDMDALLDEAKGNNFRDSFYFWNKSNLHKEKYRDEVFWGFAEGQNKISLKQMGKFISKVLDKLNSTLGEIEKKIAPTYFINEIKEYSLDSKGAVYPAKFRQKALPLFLEGPTRAIKNLANRDAKRLYRLIKKSPLYDKKLKMYKINASLTKQPLEIGRSRVFKPGWLENESIWLHMEYKYLLGILRCGLFDEFYKEFYNCFVCFLNPDTYGRSILENSSFIVSSAYFDEKLWGRGFVARLSGSTAEAINISILLCAGKEPFFTQNSKLLLEFKPALHKDLFTKYKSSLSLFVDGKLEDHDLSKDSFCFNFLGSTLVIYRNPKRLNTYSDKARITSIKIKYKDGKEVFIKSSRIPEPHSLRIRDQEADFIEAVIE